MARLNFRTWKAMLNGISIILAGEPGGDFTDETQEAAHGAQAWLQKVGIERGYYDKWETEEDEPRQNRRSG